MTRARNMWTYCLRAFRRAEAGVGWWRGRSLPLGDNQGGGGRPWLSSEGERCHRRRHHRRCEPDTRWRRRYIWRDVGVEAGGGVQQSHRRWRRKRGERCRMVVDPKGRVPLLTSPIHGHSETGVARQRAPEGGTTPVQIRTRNRRSWSRIDGRRRRRPRWTDGNAHGGGGGSKGFCKGRRRKALKRRRRTVQQCLVQAVKGSVLSGA